MRPPHRTALYEDGLVALWERLVTTFGVPTVRVLLDRAIWQTAQCYPDLALIQHDDAGLSFEALEKRYAPRSQEEIEAAFNALFAGLLLILARLVGGEMAQRLAAEPAVKAAGVASLATRPYPAQGAQPGLKARLAAAEALAHHGAYN
jgi:hypothetical protein